MKTVVVCSTFVVLLLSTGCYYDKEELLYPGSMIDCSNHPARFSDVATIVSQKCAGPGCHDATTAAGATILQTYDQVKAKAARINQRVVAEKSMPPGTPLTPVEIATIKCWIDAGMPNN